MKTRLKCQLYMIAEVPRGLWGRVKREPGNGTIQNNHILRREI